jgi:hypothetical protein
MTMEVCARDRLERRLVLLVIWNLLAEHFEFHLLLRAVLLLKTFLYNCCHRVAFRIKHQVSLVVLIFRLDFGRFGFTEILNLTISDLMFLKWY